MYHLSLLQIKICVSSCLPSCILIYSSWKSDSAPTSLTQPLYLADRLFVNRKPLVFLSPSSALFLQSFLSGRRPPFDSWVRKLPWRGIGYPLQYSWASPVAQLLKNPPAMQETWVRSLGWEDPLEKGKATRSRILAWRIPWTIWGRKESDTTELTFTFTNCIFFQIYV